MMVTRAARSLPTHLEGFVLHRYDWSESSLILELFTRERGRLAVVAKGAKRPSSQLRGVLLPFQRVFATLARERAGASGEQAEIQVLRQAEWAGGSPILPAASLFPAFYLNELLLKLLPRGDAQPTLFDAYAASLPALAVGDDALAQAALRAFELIALRESGWLPELRLTTLGQQALMPEARYALRPQSGLVFWEADGPTLAGADWLALQAALESDDVGTLQWACADRGPALRATTRTLLHYHLGTATLRTREVLQGVQQLSERARPRAETAQPTRRPAA
jgi:DNA repair protein RecO (recombination protein O)